MSSKTITRSRTSQGPSSGNKTPAPNAWARPLKPRPPPGLAPPLPKSTNIANESSISAPLTPLSNPEMRDRFLHFALSLVGHRVSLSQVDGTILEGVFHTFTPFANQDTVTRNKYVLKAVSVIKRGDQNNSKIPNGSTVIIPSEKVTHLHIKSYRMSAGNGKVVTDMLRTDAEISKINSIDKGRSLVAAGSAWTSGSPSVNPVLSNGSRAEGLLDTASNRKGKGANGQSGLRGNIGEWDQFRANKELFNVQAKFDENLYTTELDKSAMDASKIKEAERLAREIENTTSINIHVAEERNQVLQGDYDEEERYSGVLNKNMQGRSTKESISNSHQVHQQSLKQKLQLKPQAKVMNYAAAAAKADAAKPPPGFVGKKEDAIFVSKEEYNENQSEPEMPSDEGNERNEVLLELKDQKDLKENKVEKSEEKEAEEKDQQPVIPLPKIEMRRSISEGKICAEVHTEKKIEEKDESLNDERNDAERETTKGKGEKNEVIIKGEGIEDISEKKEETEKKQPSKLNANAKAFSFNPSAKTFTPGSFTAPASTPLSSPDQQHSIPVTGITTVPPQMSGQHHYMHPSIGQPVLPMINPHFPMRYGGGYPGMEQPVAPGQPHPPQHIQQIPQQLSQQSDGSTAPVGGDEQQSSDGTTQSSIQQQPPPQPQSSHPTVSMPYPPTAAPYPYGGTLTIPPRGPGGPHMGGYHPSIVGGPQQIPVVRGNPYGHMYGMPQPPPQMRPSSGYYPNAPPHYSHYMIGDDEYRSGGRAGRGGGRGRRGGRKGGRHGRWQNNPRDQHSIHNGHNGLNGRQIPQSTADEGVSTTSAQQYQSAGKAETVSLE
mmetsp:Transcript_29327/g.33474  ORF Transcript_29327/g.33474 Transcript_29327/m.33474 type:complete len:829 (+) Transcript_29327:169-2655(+)|eukprot:CAMPEP_0194139048 /NCGR_PEP_ID=MMETSP0152-20130528/8789_1 /TAXON_ID=1049557 /ORGANISM="Thalassiothrix antarctica, Strain L6-D1" /LENGTH=828 /DNA_ID=CAMNT_0038836771 /DNA_START=101 /DNA_END=2587 /DNA_ORIENTATION=-